jgi:ligand-binding sensor domain-containing protein
MRTYLALLVLALAGRCHANGGGHILTPPADFIAIAPGSVEVVLPEVHVKHAIEEDGALWAATLDRGLGHRPKGGAWSFRTAEGDRVPENALTRVARLDGRTWVGTTSKGLARLTESGFEAFGREQGLAGSEVLELVVHAGRLWVLTDAALAIFDGKAFGPAPAGEGAPQGNPTTIASAPDGRLWVGTDRTEVCGWDGKAWVRHDFTERIVGKTIKAVSTGVGHIWFGTYGSLNTFTPETGRLDDETAEKAVLFPTRLITGILSGRDRMLISTGGGGVYRYDADGTMWHLYSDANGLPSTSVNAISLSGESLLVATWSGLARVDLSKKLPAELERAKASASPAASPLSSPSPEATRK